MSSLLLLSGCLFHACRCGKCGCPLVPELKSYLWLRANSAEMDETRSSIVVCVLRKHNAVQERTADRPLGLRYNRGSCLLLCQVHSEVPDSLTVVSAMRTLAENATVRIVGIRVRGMHGSTLRSKVPVTCSTTQTLKDMQSSEGCPAGRLEL